MEARFATHKITDAALQRMAVLVEALASEQGIDIPERLRIAREFDMEIERAADNPTLRSMILSLAIIGQVRRARSVESLLVHPEAGQRRVQDHRDILAAFRKRDPDLVEQIWRRGLSPEEGFKPPDWYLPFLNDLGSLLDPVGFDQWSFTPSGPFIRGYQGALRDAWQTAERPHPAMLR